MDYPDLEQLRPQLACHEDPVPLRAVSDTVTRVWADSESPLFPRFIDEGVFCRKLAISLINPRE